MSPISNQSKSISLQMLSKKYHNIFIGNNIFHMSLASTYLKNLWHFLFSFTSTNELNSDLLKTNEQIAFPMENAFYPRF